MKYVKYGYGYGADKNQVTTYSYGGPLDGDLTGQITGSGARSIRVEDINKSAGISTEEDFEKIDNYYGSIANPPIYVHYPTINNTNGKSEKAGVKGLKYTYYLYNKDKVASNVQDILFKGNRYWLASCCVVTNSDFVSFRVRNVTGSDVRSNILCSGYNPSLSEYPRDDSAVRPLVTIKSEVIDIDAGYNGVWKLK